MESDDAALLSVKDLAKTGCLAGVTADFARGKLCAVLGPSGAGKTTFFSVRAPCAAAPFTPASRGSSARRCCRDGCRGRAAAYY